MIQTVNETLVSENKEEKREKRGMLLLALLPFLAIIFINTEMGHNLILKYVSILN